MGVERYKVTLISNDLRREETVQQYADELNYLERISKDVFSRYGKQCFKQYLVIPSIGIIFHTPNF